MKTMKKEVKELCVKLRNSQPHSKEFKETERELEGKYRFTPFALLALWLDPPTIEYSHEQIPLIFEETEK